MNIFIVASPLQLFNAMEAKAYFHLKSSDCVLIIFDSLSTYQRNNYQQIQCMLAEDDFVKIIHISRYNHSLGWIHSFWQFIKLARLFDAVENIFVGECRTDLVRNFVHSIRYKQVYLLDDGNGTLQIYNYLSSDISKRKLKYKTNREKIISFIKSNIFRSNIAEIEQLKYFTVYDIGKDDGNVVQHNYQHFRASFPEKLIYKSVYFLGTNISEMHIMDQNVYLDYIKRIKAYFGEDLFYYIPHRGESSEKIERIAGLGIKIKRLNTCIEYELGMSDSLPDTFASFYSAALENCHAIFGSSMKIKSFSICPTDLDPKVRDDIQCVYRYYRHILISGNFQVVDLACCQQ